VAAPGLGDRRRQGIGKHVALRLLRDGEDVVDVPPKLSARARVFATGNGRKTDPA
jgi:transposase